MENLGQYLKQCRKINRLTLRNVEEATGISNAYLSQLENGKIRKPSPQFLGKLASVYNTPYQKLMTIAGYLPEAELVKAKEDTSSFLFNGEKITEEEANKLREYLAFLRSSL